MGTNEYNTHLFSFLRDMLQAHAAENKYWITYLLQDNIIMYAYEHFESVKTMIDSCPQNNLRRNDLHFLLNSTYDQDKYDQLINNDWIFKLSYKTPWKKRDGEGNLTFYGKLLEDNGL